MAFKRSGVQIPYPPLDPTATELPWGLWRAGRKWGNMNTARWKAADEFPLLALGASYDFRSGSTVSFSLGTRGDSLKLADMDEPFVCGPGLVFTVVGWADVHHSCDGHIKTQIRVCLPEEYHRWERMKELVDQLFAVLEIPGDETFEAHF